MIAGLADTLHSELQLYGLDVHCYFAPTMNSPGYAEEMKTLPKITAKIEEDDMPVTCDHAALSLLTGMLL
jgi:3-dehydrosphinganine reductase